MARRTFDVIDIVEILVHWQAGRSQHEIADSLRVDRKTIRRYTAPAVVAGMVPGEPARSRAEGVELVRGWFPHVVDTRLRQVTWPAIEVHRDYVVAQLELGVTAATIHQRLRDEHRLDVSVASFRRWVRAKPA
jgi:DNA-binding transcriptional regulator LsrR (DeoR family)